MTLIERSAIQPPAVTNGTLRWARRFWVTLVLVAVGLGTASTIAVVHGEALSPIDEWVYVDYLYKLPSHGIVLKGEPIGEDALNIMACYGVTPYGPMGPACGGDYRDLKAFPFGGITSADQYTPIFFVVTRVVGDAIRSVTGVDDVTGWRLTSPLWLAGGLIAFVALLRQWRVHPIAQLALGLAFIGSPFSYWTYTYVSTDAPAFMFGALLLYLVTRFTRGSPVGLWLVILSVAATLIKTTNILGVGLVVITLLIGLGVRKRKFGESSLEGQPSLVSTLGFAAVITLATFGSLAFWMYLNSVTAASHLRAEQGVSRVLNLDELLAQVTNFLPGTIVSNVNIAGSTGYALPIPGYATVPLSWLCVAGVIGALFLLTQDSKKVSMVLSVVIAAALFAPTLALALQVVTGNYFTLPPRYGASLLPGFLLLAGTIMKNRWASGLVAVYGGVMCIALVIAGAILGPYFSH